MKRRFSGGTADHRPVVLIGTTSTSNSKAIPTVVNALVEGLSSKYRFVLFHFERRFGSTRLARLNLLNVYYFLKHLVLWIYLLISHRPDMVHYPVGSHWNLEKSLILLKFGKVFRAKTIGHLHSGEFLDFWKTLSPLRKRFARKVLEELNALILLSEGWRHNVESEIGLDRARMFVVHNPIDASFESQVLTIPVERDTEMILSFGVMARQKGILDIIEASRVALQDSRFVLYLTGPEREPNITKQCRKLIQNYSLSEQLFITGGVYGDEKIDLFRRASIFLMPSYVENFPLAILEAAAAGLPIIATPVGALPEFFRDEESILFVQPGNVHAISSAVKRLMQNPPERHSMGKAARAVFVERLSRDQIFQSLDSTYQHVMAQ